MYGGIQSSYYKQFDHVGSRYQDKKIDYSKDQQYPHHTFHPQTNYGMEPARLEELRRQQIQKSVLDSLIVSMSQALSELKILKEDQAIKAPSTCSIEKLAKKKIPQIKDRTSRTYAQYYCTKFVALLKNPDLKTTNKFEPANRMLDHIKQEWGLGSEKVSISESQLNQFLAKCKFCGGKGGKKVRKAEREEKGGNEYLIHANVMDCADQLREVFWPEFVTDLRGKDDQMRASLREAVLIEIGNFQLEKRSKWRQLFETRLTTYGTVFAFLAYTAKNDDEELLTGLQSLRILEKQNKNYKTMKAITSIKGSNIKIRIPKKKSTKKAFKSKYHFQQ